MFYGINHMNGWTDLFIVDLWFIPATFSILIPLLMYAVWSITKLRYETRYAAKAILEDRNNDGD